MKRVRCLMAVLVVLLPCLVFAHGDFDTKKVEYTNAIGAALDVYHREVSENFVQIDSWKNGNNLNVQIYKTSNESFAFECHFAENRIDCHRH